MGYQAKYAGNNVDNIDEVILAYSDGHDTPQSLGTIGKLCRRGWSGPEPGHVFTLYFAYPEADSENYLAPDIQGLSPDLG